MDAAAELEVIQSLFFTDRRQAMEKLSEFVESARGKNRAAAMTELVKRVDQEHPGLAAYFALAGGAIVEEGEEASALGRALVAPLERSLVAAGRMYGYVAHLPDHQHDHGHDHDHEHAHDDDHDHAHDDAHDHAHSHGHNGGDHDHDDGHHHGHNGGHHHEEHIDIGSKAVTRDILDAIADKDLVAVQAWFSMDIWYRPAVATWTREPAVLQEVQQRGALREALAALGSGTESSHWLGLLIETVFDAPFVVLFPETNEAWRMQVDGVVDMGQLSVLMAPALAEPLARIGITELPEDDVVAVMAGEGPQQGEGAYSCAFHCYPIEASDPATAMPRDNVHTWRAPGGTGGHSLPPDFQPGTLEVIDGARVLVVVGRSMAVGEGVRFTRGIDAVRMFDGLMANVSGATRLPAGEAQRWFGIAKQHGV